MLYTSHCRVRYQPIFHELAQRGDLCSTQTSHSAGSDAHQGPLFTGAVLRHVHIVLKPQRHPVRTTTTLPTKSMNQGREVGREGWAGRAGGPETHAPPSARVTAIFLNGLETLHAGGCRDAERPALALRRLVLPTKGLRTDRFRPGRSQRRTHSSDVIRLIADGCTYTVITSALVASLKGLSGTRPIVGVYVRKMKLGTFLQLPLEQSFG